MMKHLSFLCVVLLIAACAGSADKQTAVSSEVSNTDTVYYSFDQDNVHSSITAVRPAATLAKPVGEWLSESLGGYFSGDVTDLQAMVDFYGKAVTDTLRSNARELGNLEAEMEFEAEMGLFCETDCYATYEFETYLGLGGAHPTSRSEGVTFRKSDGRRVGWDIIRRDCLYLFNELLKQDIKDYLGVETDKEMEDMLFDVSADNIPLPKTPPYLTTDGLAFVYQQYEIGAYALGLPSGIIPYEKIKPLLTSWGQQLLEE